MARTKNKKASAPIGPQAPAGAWSPDALLAALKKGTSADKREALKQAGILDASGNLTKTYESWGSRVTRTPNADDMKAKG